MDQEMTGSPLIDLTNIVFSAFVYFLIHNGEVVYVGQSKKVGSRLRTHMADKVFDRVSVIETAEANLGHVEAAFIRLLKPKYNRALSEEKPSSADVNLVANLGFAVDGKQLLSVSEFQYGCFGRVIAIGDEFVGRIGYYDDDEWVHYCDEFFDESDLSPDDFSDEAHGKICEARGCGDRAIVYFDLWDSGCYLIPYSNLKLVHDVEDPTDKIVVQLFPDASKEGREDLKTKMHIF